MLPRPGTSALIAAPGPQPVLKRTGMQQACSARKRCPPPGPSHDEAVADVIGRHGPIGIRVNHAGRSHAGAAEETGGSRHPARPRRHRRGGRAAAALFCMADNYVTGQIITVDGGESLV